MLPGTLVLNITSGNIEQVKSIQFDGTKKERCALGPRLLGKINGKPISDYGPLPVTDELLSALGWKVDKQNSTISAWPPVDNLKIPSQQKR